MAKAGDPSKAKVASMNFVTSSDHSGRVPIVLAVTGHRIIPKEDEGALCTSVNGELNFIAKSNPHSPLILISALAEGADRLVANCALNLGWKLCAVLCTLLGQYRLLLCQEQCPDRVFYEPLAGEWRLDYRHSHAPGTLYVGHDGAC